MVQPTTSATVRSVWMTRLTAPPLLIWLTKIRQRSQTTVWKWRQFTAAFPPSQLSLPVASGSAPATLRKRSSRRPALAKRVKRSLLDENAFDDDANVRTELFNDFQDVRSQKYGRTARDVAGQQIADDVRGHRVHALKRLVEEQQVRIGQQGRRERQLLLHAVRVFEGQLFLLVLKAEQRQQLADAVADQRRAAADACGR